MTLIILVPLVVCILGGFMFALSANSKLVRLGEMCFFAGLLVTLPDVANHVINIR